MATLISLPTYRKAPLTAAAIDAAIDADGGSLFRQLERKWFPTIEDAYRAQDGGFRSHLGASQIGRPCVRETYLNWRWSFKKIFKPRMVRLVNRGHLEEARFLAMLEMIGVQFHLTESGEQERISDHGGHYGSALDGVLWGVPDMPGEWILGEFKTSNTKNFAKMVTGGVQKTKPEHYEQMQSCMGRRGIFWTLYIMVNKDDDDLHFELVQYDIRREDSIRGKAADIITRRTAPPRISDDPSNRDCGYCDAKQRCHFPHEAPLTGVFVNCRTCRHSVADIPSGTWGCELRNIVLDKSLQLTGCDQHDPIPDLIRR